MRSVRIAAIALSAILACTGCHKVKRVPVATFPPPLPPPPVPETVSAPPPTPEPPPPPPPAPAPSPLEEADRAFASGNYDDAAKVYDNYVKTMTSGPDRDQALFRLALTFILRPAPDWPHATTNFKQLIDEYPQSPLKPPASLILSLRSDLDKVNTDAKQRDDKIKQLTTELDRLKKIDSERRKRP
jgi:hypothetical protein